MPGRWILLVVFILLASPPRVAAQSYQESSDSLVAVHVRKLTDRERPVEFRLCARLLRPAPGATGPVEVRLSFRNASGEILAQAASIVVLEGAASVCRRISLPEGARGFERWEISRWRFRPAQASPPYPRPSHAG
ncbi:MAG: hypothetical protein WC713_14210 [Candidatus Methylomirabilota bacterium]